MSIAIATKEEQKALDAFLDTPIDWDLTGTPILRRDTYTPTAPVLGGFELGWHARARNKGEPDGYRFRFPDAKDKTWRYCEKMMQGFDPSVVEVQPLFS